MSFPVKFYHWFWKSGGHAIFARLSQQLSAVSGVFIGGTAENPVQAGVPIWQGVYLTLNDHRGGILVSVAWRSLLIHFRQRRRDICQARRVKRFESQFRVVFATVIKGPGTRGEAFAIKLIKVAAESAGRLLAWMGPGCHTALKLTRFQRFHIRSPIDTITERDYQGKFEVRRQICSKRSDGTGFEPCFSFRFQFGWRAWAKN